MLDDVRERIAPKIVGAPKQQRQLPFLPGLQKAFANTVVAIAVGAVILTVVVFVEHAFETIGNAIMSPLGISLLVALLTATALVFLL